MPASSSATARLEAAVRTVADTAAARRSAWDALDAAAGDGDFGSTLDRGFATVLDRWDDLDRESERAFLTDVSRVLASAMGGTSGPLWSVAVLRAGGVCEDGVGAMLAAAVAGIQEYGEAEQGDKTLLDALIPAAKAAGGGADVVAAALGGAEATRALRARRGRGAYAGHRTVGTADPGAVAIAVLAAALAGDGPGPDDRAARLEALHRTDGADRDDAGDDDAPASAAPATKAKQLINDPRDAATESLEGFALAHAQVSWDGERRILTHTGGPVPDRVGLVSGGGSGHEPMHGGFIGDGMLTAVAPGEVFSSPTVDQVLAAVRAANGGAGVLQVVKNYTGDVLNFRLAAELAREEGIDVASVIVAEDVASGSGEHGVGRRGTGATPIVEKIAGARAAAGGTLAEVAAVAQRVADASASLGVALYPCSPPGAGPLFALGDDEIELGVGIHGELGTERGPLRPADELVADVLDTILDDLIPPDGARLLAFVNGFGGSAVLELYIVYRAVVQELERRGLRAERSLVGNYVTSLDMAGMSITLVALDPELTELWDAPVVTPALRWGA